MNPSVKDILSPHLEKLAEKASRHPVYDWSSFEDSDGQDGFLGYSLSFLCGKIMEKGCGAADCSGLPVESFLDEFRKRGLKVYEDTMPFAEACTWYVVKAANLKYSLRRQQVQTLVKVKDNEYPGWSAEVGTTPERFADYLMEFDSCVEWLRETFVEYISERQKQKMINEIKAVTREARQQKEY